MLGFIFLCFLLNSIPFYNCGPRLKSSFCSDTEQLCFWQLCFTTIMRVLLGQSAVVVALTLSQPQSVVGKPAQRPCVQGALPVRSMFWSQQMTSALVCIPFPDFSLTSFLCMVISVKDIFLPSIYYIIWVEESLE